MHADKVVKMVEGLRLEALAEMPKEGNAPLSEYSARLLHNAALGNTMFGHIPPPRLSCLRTLQVILFPPFWKAELGEIGGEQNKGRA